MTAPVLRMVLFSRICVSFFSEWMGAMLRYVSA